MAQAQKTQEQQQIEHAYATLEHQEWSEEMKTWQNDHQRIKETLSRVQNWIDQHENELRNHEEALKRHEEAVRQHGEGVTTGDNIHYIKDVSDRRHALYGKTHAEQKTIHEALKHRHYILIGQINLLAQAAEQEKL